MPNASHNVHKDEPTAAQALTAPPIAQSSLAKTAAVVSKKKKSKRVEKMDLKQLKKLGTVKSLLLGDRSKGVLLLEGGVVAKTYDKTSKRQVGRFDKEVAVLKQLQGCAYVPKLYQVDDTTKTIYMEYVGKNVALNQEQKLAVNRALRHIGERYHVFRVKDGKARFSYRDLFPANICVDNTGNVKLIDFGSALWAIHRRSYKTYLAH